MRNEYENPKIIEKANYYLEWLDNEIESLIKQLEPFEAVKLQDLLSKKVIFNFCVKYADHFSPSTCKEIEVKNHFVRGSIKSKFYENLSQSISQHKGEISENKDDYKILIINNFEYPVVNYEWTVKENTVDGTKVVKYETLTIEIDVNILEKWQEVIFSCNEFNVTDKNGKSRIFYLPSEQISNFFLWQKQYREYNLKIEMNGVFPEFDREIKLESV